MRREGAVTVACSFFPQHFWNNCFALYIIEVLYILEKDTFYTRIHEKGSGDVVKAVLFRGIVYSTIPLYT